MYGSRIREMRKRRGLTLKEVAEATGYTIGHISQIERDLKSPSLVALRKIAAELNKSECTIIFINQLREKIGVMFGNPETTTGGRALKFYSSVRIEIRRGEAIKQGTEIVGNKTNIKVVKNKVAPPFKTTQVDIIYGKGISRDGEVLDLAVENDIVEKSGAWYAYKGEKIGQGRENAKTYLTTHPDIMEEITQTIVKNIEEANNLK